MKTIVCPRHWPAVLTFAFISASPAALGQLLTDDFESYAAGSALTTSGPWATATTGLTVRDEAAAAPFGDPNQYLDYNDAGGASVRLTSSNISGTVGELTTYSFDFNEPSGGGGDELIIGYANKNGDLDSNTNRLRMQLDDGVIKDLTSAANPGTSDSYSLDTSYRLYVVFNDTGAAESIAGELIASQEAGVWIHPIGGSLTFVGRDNPSANSVSDQYRVGFRSFSTQEQQVLIDNVSLDAGAALPDSDPPVLTAKEPEGATLPIHPDVTPTATFDRRIIPGSGNITLKKTDGDVTVATLDVTDPAQVAFSGSSLRLLPPSPLDLDTEYYVLIDNGAIESIVGVDYPGISDTTTWSFKTATSLTPVAATFSAADRIEGRAESTSTGYFPGDGGSGQVGIGGGTGSRIDVNLVLSYDLPTLPAGTTVGAATFNFEISNYFNHSGADPALEVYLLDSSDPSTTGTTFFYHGPADPNPEVERVGSTDISLPQGTSETYDPDEQDHSHTLTGDALALMQSFYGGDHVPDQTTVYFRFNLSNLIKPGETGEGADLSGSTLDRYFVIANGDESGLVIDAIAASGPYDTWVTSFDWSAYGSPDQTPTGNPDLDLFSNLFEFAFGTDPTVSDSSSLIWTDPTFTPGSPVVARSSPGGEFRARFVRRTDAGDPGSVNYAWRFSSDLADWESSDDAPTWLVAPTPLGTDGDYQLVEVPFPSLDSGPDARFFQVEVTEVP
ncbi:Ig-like domain-containing protein [Haloferula sp. A504]|uniref:Ig-like domain-containing protein n=1 Tax=Haloferula sp. A504 TaxID=3373601 RepID=UPI0031C5B7F9|nr:Ig-like domain-containing protein [Verrucomicrobiaceae bacterium E54]